jgi:hypothetical protein
MLDENQQFIFDQIKLGLQTKIPAEPITDIDIDRLSWDGSAYSSLPDQEWNEWSRKIHWALQSAFLHDTSNWKDKERLMVWKNKCLAVVLSALAKGEKEPPVLENAVFHFVQQDLFQGYPYKNLTNEEKKFISAIGPIRGTSGKSCLIAVLVLVSLVVAAVLLIFIL